MIHAHVSKKSSGGCIHITTYFLLAFPPKPYMHSSSSIRATCHAHLIFLFLIILIIFGEKYKLCSFLQPPVISFLFRQNILNTLFSNTISLFCSCNIRNEVLHPYRTTGKIIVSYIPIFTLLDSRREDKISPLNGSKYYPNSICSLFHHESNFNILLSFQKIFGFYHIFKDSISCLSCHDVSLHSGDETATNTQFSLPLLLHQPPY
jgi:hypothetical protein